MKKLFLSVFLSFIFLTTPIFAESVDYLNKHQNDLILEYDESKMDYIKVNPDSFNYYISPFAVDACPGRGDHEMVSRGWGTLIRVDSAGNKTTVFKGGACWQCKYCKEVLVTEYDPLQTEYVGYYAMRNPGYVISAYGAVVEAPSIAIRHTEGRKVPYCRLFYN